MVAEVEGDNVQGESLTCYMNSLRSELGRKWHLVDFYFDMLQQDSYSHRRSYLPDTQTENHAYLAA